MACLHQYIRPQVYHCITKPDQIRLDSILPPRQLNVQVSFEIFGNLTGVYFTKYATEIAEKLGIKGWIMLNKRGVIRGQIEGEKDKVDEMALWLRLQGSPGAKVDHALILLFQQWDYFRIIP